MRIPRRVTLVALSIVILYWLGMRKGWAPMTPTLFAWGVGLLVGCALWWASQTLILARRERNRPFLLLSEAMLALGLVLMGCGGMANWLLGLQGSVILLEGEKSFLSDPSQLNAFEAGPLAKGLEMGGLLELLEVRLVSVEDGFHAESHLRFVRKHGEQPQELSLTPSEAASVGTLRFYQGAFGFAPRLVLLHGDKTLLDQEVPFRTQNMGQRLLSFEGDCRVEAEKIDLAGAVSLEELNEEMKGHPILGIEVRREGKLLGRGELLPGHFAELEEGYRIGFAGMKRWSEIAISRKNYPLPVFIGFGMMLLGLVVWPLAAWRKW